LIQDEEIRKHILKEFKAAGIPRIEIERTGEAVNVIVHTARPGVLVGRKGVRVDQLKESLQKITGMTCHLTVREIKRPELEATLVAEVVAEALEKRMAFRRAMKKAIQTTMQAGAKGIKLELNGRLGGAEMAREAKEREGQVPAVDAARQRRLRHRLREDHLRHARREGVDLQGRARAGREGGFPPVAGHGHARRARARRHALATHRTPSGSTAMNVRDRRPSPRINEGDLQSWH